MNHKPTTLHYLHQENQCPGYSSFVKEAIWGRLFKFNLFFLLFQNFYLIYYKMYFEAILYTFIIGACLGLITYNPYLSFFLLTSVIFIFNISFYKIYQLKIDRILYKNNYNPQLFIKKISPHSPFKFLVISFFMCIPLSYSLLFGILCGLSSVEKNKFYETFYTYQTFHP